MTGFSVKNCDFHHNGLWVMGYGYDLCYINVNNQKRVQGCGLIVITVPAFIKPAREARGPEGPAR